MSPSAMQPRLRWRVIVPTAGRPDQARGVGPLAWHLAGCADPKSTRAHCAIGQRRLLAAADPDGHCLIDAACLRCADAGVGATPGGPNRTEQADE
jgi:hypothetical protein